MIYKQFTAIMLGVFLVFGGIFFVIRAGMTARFSTISENYVAETDQIFDASARIGELLARRLGEDKISPAELPLLLEQTLTLARKDNPEILALVVAFEQSDKMLIVRQSGDKIEILDGFGYSQKDWYLNAKDTGRGIWSKPIIGDFIKEPISIYTQPFYVGGKFGGVVCVDISFAFLHEQEFSANLRVIDVALLVVGIIGLCAIGGGVFVISSHHLKPVIAEQEVMKNELKIAREIQMGILPKTLPPCELFEIDAFLTPANEVGGDLYDFFFISPTKLCVVVGDVSGKGVPASLFMAVTQTLHRGLAQSENSDPADITRRINQSLFNDNSGGMFVTYIIAVIDFATRTMTYCNAGHNPFLLIKNDGTVSTPCERHGIPLGVRENRVYGKSELKLEHGDTLFFYTDGITEAKNKAGEFFGSARLISVLENAEGQNVNEINEKIKSALASFVGSAEQFDDITAVALCYTCLK